MKSTTKVLIAAVPAGLLLWLTWRRKRRVEKPALAHRGGTVPLAARTAEPITQLIRDESVLEAVQGETSDESVDKSAPEATIIESRSPSGVAVAESHADDYLEVSVEPDGGGAQKPVGSGVAVVPAEAIRAATETESVPSETQDFANDKASFKDAGQTATPITASPNQVEVHQNGTGCDNRPSESTTGDLGVAQTRKRPRYRPPPQRAPDPAKRRPPIQQPRNRIDLTVFLDRRIDFETPNEVARSSSWFATAWFTSGLNIGRPMSFANLATA